MESNYYNNTMYYDNTSNYNNLNNNYNYYNDFYDINSIISYYSNDTYREMTGKIIEISIYYNDYTIELLDKNYMPLIPQKLDFISLDTKIRVIRTPNDIKPQ